MGPVVVTGASGYLGGCLVAALVERGIPVRSIVRRARPWLDATEQHVADLARDDLGAAFDKASVVVHLAGPNEVVAAGDPDGSIAATVEGTQRVVRAARDVRRIVYVSTMHVYGGAIEPGRRIDETVTPEPKHPYAVARLRSEEAIDTSGLDAVILRLTNSVGAPADPRVDRWSLVANDLCREAVLDGTVTLQSDGSQWRDFVALGDVARIVADIASDPIAGGTYNLGSGEPWTVRHLAERIVEHASDVFGARPELVAPPPGVSTEPYVIDVAKLASVGHRPQGSVDDALVETLRFCERWKAELRTALGDTADE